jgi:hypothetical protein
MSRILDHYTDPMGRITDEGYARINPRKYDPNYKPKDDPIAETEEFIHEWMEALPDAA